MLCSQSPPPSADDSNLVYAVLAFHGNKPGKKQAKFVIHGDTDKTVYSTVDFTQTAEPLPESDSDG